MVGAAPARALEVEYAKRDIIERVNRYLGYRAATELTATPDYSVPPEEEPTRRREPAKASPRTGADAGDPLKAALARLGEAVAQRGF